MIERFGPDGRLVGVLGSGDPAKPVLVLPNAGLVPRSGPFRVHVEIAQRLERSGVATFRFDLPGVGEAPHLAGIDAQAATRAALDHLAERGVAERFVVGGICSAADRGWLTAVADPRVAGVLMLDGLCHTGPWFQLARIAGVLARPPRQWLGVLRRHAGAAAAAEAGTALAAAAYREWPSRAEAQAQLRALLARDVRVLFVYTHGVTEYFRDPRQFAWSFGSAARDPRVSFHYWRDCDHTFYARAARDRLLDTLERWFGEAFAAAGAAR